MDRRAFLTAAGAAALVPALSGSAGAQAAIDYGAIDRIRTLGLTAESSKVMELSSHMMDVLGPRLSGSPAIRTSGEWVVSKLREWGVTGAALEPWPADPTGTNNGFPNGWSNSKFYVHAVSPLAFPINGMSVAWTPGTNGLVRGECVLVTDSKEEDLNRNWAGKLRGKWVFGQAAPEIRSQWDPVARRWTREQLDGFETPARGPENGSPGSNAQARPPQNPAQNPTGQPQFDRNAWFFREGALGVFATNKGQGVVNVLGSSRTVAPNQPVPRINIETEHYGRIARSLAQGVTVVVEADIRNDWHPNPEMFNVVGEIKGSDRSGEVVIIGAHFDSYHAATGATDNGGNCAAAMEAMRLLKLAEAPLKRTVRICLWNGEEQGLIGSRLYVAKHFGGVRGAPTQDNARGVVQEFTREHAKLQAYFNLDNGSGAIRGINAQGNRAAMPILRQWTDVFRDIGATHVSPRSSGSTDHVPFDQAGLPGFQFIQDPIDYEPKTHHTNMDFYESLQPEDMRRNATILAGFAMLAANHPTLLPRKPYVRPTEPQTTAPRPPVTGPNAN